MDKMITLYVNNQPITVKSGTVVAAALAQAGISRFHDSPSGHGRGPLCGMGVCFECTVTIDGIPHCKSCDTICCEGMKVQTPND